MHHQPIPREYLEEIRVSVQRNCHIADARHGSEYGLCTYLMKMREYFRWEMGRGFNDNLGKDEVGDWLTEREDLWSRLGESEYTAIRVEGRDYDPFDNQAINRSLLDYGLVYSGGLGYTGRPHFFLAELEHKEELPDYSLYVSGIELARDLAAPPAMTRGDLIFVRRESVRRMLWEKLETWRWARPDNALGRAFACYDFERDLHASLEAMTGNELELVMLHERGECLAGDRLGEQWNRMLLDLTQTPAELVARSVRDHLADCLVTLPALAEMGRDASIHFYMGNLNAMRKELVPGLFGVYESWLSDRDSSSIGDIARRGVDHWSRSADKMLDLYRAEGAEAAVRINRLAESIRL
jgi:hypothetical protein